MLNTILFLQLLPGQVSVKDALNFWKEYNENYSTFEQFLVNNDHPKTTSDKILLLVKQVKDITDWSIPTSMAAVKGHCVTIV